jgi:predicted small lipoprotein YifL
MRRGDVSSKDIRRGLLVATLAGVCLLAACGKKGPPDPPGPPSAVTYPKAYPTR